MFNVEWCMYFADSKNDKVTLRKINNGPFALPVKWNGVEKRYEPATENQLFDHCLYFEDITIIRLAMAAYGYQCRGFGVYFID